jgi:hypothetical protein
MKGLVTVDARRRGEFEEVREIDIERRTLGGRPYGEGFGGRRNGGRGYGLG